MQYFKCFFLSGRELFEKILMLQNVVSTLILQDFIEPDIYNW